VLRIGQWRPNRRRNRSLLHDTHGIRAFDRDAPAVSGPPKYTLRVAQDYALDRAILGAIGAGATRSSAR